MVICNISFLTFQNMSDSDASMETDEDERVILAREAAMPLEDLMRSYKAHGKVYDTFLYILKSQVSSFLLSEIKES